MKSAIQRLKIEKKTQIKYYSMVHLKMHEWIGQGQNHCSLVVNVFKCNAYDLTTTFKVQQQQI
jgi:hypothetical protein